MFPNFIPLEQYNRLASMIDKNIKSSIHDPFFPRPAHQVAFKPRRLKNLLEADTMNSLSPIVDMKVLDAAAEGDTQIYSLCGRGPRSTLRVLRHGLGVQEMAVSDLPGRPYAVWSVKQTNASRYHKYIIVSFVDVTLVLSIGDTVEEVLDSGFLATAPTLLIALMEDDSHVQVHPTGIRHLLPRRTNEWRAPGNKRIKVGQFFRCTSHLCCGATVRWSFVLQGGCVSVPHPYWTSDKT